MSLQTVTTWHLFADNYDEFYGTLNEAIQAYVALCKEYTNVRLYEQISDIDGIEVEEYYINGQGEYPY